MSRLGWESIVEEAVAIVRGYDTGVTLGQLFYRLVAAELLPNAQVAYKALSSYMAESGGFRSQPYGDRSSAEEGRVKVAAYSLSLLVGPRPEEQLAGETKTITIE